MPMKKNIENIRKLTWIYLWGSRQTVRGCFYTSLHVSSVFTCYALCNVICGNTYKGKTNKTTNTFQHYIPLPKTQGQGKSLHLLGMNIPDRKTQETEGMGRVQTELASCWE